MEILLQALLITLQGNIESFDFISNKQITVVSTASANINYIYI